MLDEAFPRRRFVYQSAARMTVVLMLCCRAGSAQVGASSSATSVSVDQAVTIIVSEDNNLKVEPSVFLLTPSCSGIDFEVKGLKTGYSLELDFLTQGGLKGPFVPEPSAIRGRYEFQGGGKTKQPSGAIDSKKITVPSVWKYEVVLRKGNADIKAIDPMGVFR